MRAAIVDDPAPNWVTLLDRLAPGAWVAYLGMGTLQARRAGFEVRDSIMVMTPNGPTVCWLFRKPLQEATVARQALLTGTGGINIEACRIGYQGEVDQALADPGGSTTSRTKRLAGGEDRSERRHFDWEQPTSGRWPANFVILHHPECQCLGTTTTRATSVPAGQPPIAVRRGGAHQLAKGHQTPGREQPVTGYVNPDGTETIADWKCHPDCPAETLNLQGETAGISRAGNKGPSSGTKTYSLPRGFQALLSQPQLLRGRRLQSGFQILLSGPQLGSPSELP